MRITGALAAVLALVTAVPALAKDSRALVTDPLAALLLLPSTVTSLHVAPDLRVRFGLGPAPSEADGVIERLQPRFVSAMIDFYPISGRGFHVSAGSRFSARRNFAAEAENAARGLIYQPRGGGGTLRAGFKRFAPAMTLGYTGDVAPGMTLGLEAGARMGRAFTAMPRLRGDDRFGDIATPNPLVNMVWGLRF
ncbi:MAG TPA: hypothetical protein VM900_13785 [Sphingomonas sp.]|nr:hypothetical protein [Sphingomonas sp.]